MNLRLDASQVAAVRAALEGELRDWLEVPALLRQPAHTLSADDRRCLHDAAVQALLNAGPIVRSYTARRASGTYPVWIVGLDGVYLLLALGHDPSGPFATLAEAVDAMEANHGAYLVGG